ncbi:MAG: hypothetical protein M1825_003032 [Sarcosagium campestre]|nr:MAG: hypothetical protein M1825_003032 [Sarcosagium campestre]
MANATPSSLLASNFGKRNGSEPPLSQKLYICRNKHWRHISSLHGPWLHLPIEVLESLAHFNLHAPRPRPIEPALFFDLLKIRRLVEEATTLAVRAITGVTAAELSNSRANVNNVAGGMNVLSLGLALGGSSGAGNARLSSERKHRMRELATQKLSMAYHLDELSASVATMQCTSSLEEVAKLVLRRSVADCDAKYVHFFHEKIPSRQLAEHVNMDVLDELVAANPSDAELWRTRGITKMLIEDYLGSTRDLTHALAICKLPGGQLARASSWQTSQKQDGHDHKMAQSRSGSDEETCIDDADRPSSLVVQLQFYRATAYLSTACQYIEASLEPQDHPVSHGPSVDRPEGEEQHADSLKDEMHIQSRMEAKKLVRTNAKRAMRDYLAFLSHLEYSPQRRGANLDHFDGSILKSAKSEAQTLSEPSEPLEATDVQAPRSSSATAWCDPEHALGDGRQLSNYKQPTSAAAIHLVSDLFTSVPIADLQPYPTSETNPENTKDDDAAHKLGCEAVTYHPLLAEALHSLLLCHCLIQTSPKELLRHAYMVARLARLCDGYPVFSASRSPSRADWVEILHQTNDWLPIQKPWEELCHPAPLASREDESVSNDDTTESSQQIARISQARGQEDQDDVTLGPGNEIMHDRASLQTALYPRTRGRVGPQLRGRNSLSAAKPRVRWAQGDGREYPISTPRAADIIRWILAGNATGNNGLGPAKSKKSSSKKKRRPKGKEIAVGADESTHTSRTSGPADGQSSRNSVIPTGQLQNIPAEA